MAKELKLWALKLLNCILLAIQLTIQLTIQLCSEGLGKEMCGLGTMLHLLPCSVSQRCNFWKCWQMFGYFSILDLDERSPCLAARLRRVFGRKQTGTICYFPGDESWLSRQGFRQNNKKTPDLGFEWINGVLGHKLPRTWALHPKILAH